MAASEKEKLSIVTSLVDTLTRDLSSPAYPTTTARDAALDQLKIHGRDPSNADPIFTPQGISTLAEHAFRAESPPSTARHALRVLANALLLVPPTREILKDLKRERDLVKVMRGLEENGAGWDDEFLGTRVLFLLTYAPNFEVTPLLDDGLAEVVCANLSRHVEKSTDMMEDMAFSESAKFVFNATVNKPQVAAAFTCTIGPLVKLLWRVEPSPKAPLSPPLGLVINGLMNLDFSLADAQVSLFPTTDETKVAARLVALLTLALAAYADAELESTTAPLATVIRHLHATAPPTPKKYLRTALLPTDEDRKSILGRGETLAARLLHTSANPMTPALRETISHLFFEMSDSDPQTFVDNIGYGYASGFLFQNGMAAPMNSSSKDDEETGDMRPVNPITGQFRDFETHADVPDMTDEEKEREAERLFVLFQRLRENGVIQVDPMREALEAGRFEELPDDEEVD